MIYYCDSTYKNANARMVIHGTEFIYAYDDEKTGLVLKYDIPENWWSVTALRHGAVMREKDRISERLAKTIFGGNTPENFLEAHESDFGKLMRSDVDIKEQTTLESFM